MGMGIVNVLKANTAEKGVSPATGADARPVLTPAELADYDEIPLRCLQSYYLTRDKPDRGWDTKWGNFVLEEPMQPANWRLILTPERLIVWTDLVKPAIQNFIAIGKPKLKPGQSTGGQVRYQWIGNIGLNDSGALLTTPRPSLTLPFNIQPGRYTTGSTLAMTFQSDGQASDVMNRLTSRISSFWQRSDIDDGKKTSVAEMLSSIQSFNWSSAESNFWSLNKAGARILYLPD